MKETTAPIVPESARIVLPGFGGLVAYYRSLSTDDRVDLLLDLEYEEHVSIEVLGTPTTDARAR
jgi:hypothetical protein